MHCLDSVPNERNFYFFNIFLSWQNIIFFSLIQISIDCCTNLASIRKPKLTENYAFQFRDQSTHMSLLSHMSFGCERVIIGRHYPVQDQLNPCCSFETRLPTLLIVDFWILYKFYPINFRYCFLQSKFLLYNFPTFPYLSRSNCYQRFQLLQGQCPTMRPCWNPTSKKIWTVTWKTGPQWPLFLTCEASCRYQTASRPATGTTFSWLMPWSCTSELLQFNIWEPKV